MARTLYELCGDGDLRFSPYCWRTRLALQHKGLDYETEPVRFTEKPKIAFSGQKLLPVLKDGETVVSDSWAIAEYLEDSYPDGPALFPGNRGRQYARMTQDWMDPLHGLIAKSIVCDICGCLNDEDQAYFRESREGRFGKTLEEVQAGRAAARAELQDSFASMRAHLADGLFVAGDAPAYSDFIVFGSLRWADLCSDYPLFAPDDPVALWYGRVKQVMSVN